MKRSGFALGLLALAIATSLLVASGTASATSTLEAAFTTHCDAHQCFGSTTATVSGQTLVQTKNLTLNSTASLTLSNDNVDQQGRLINLTAGSTLTVNHGTVVTNGNISIGNFSGFQHGHVTVDGGAVPLLWYAVSYVFSVLDPANLHSQSFCQKNQSRLFLQANNSVELTKLGKNLAGNNSNPFNHPTDALLFECGKVIGTPSLTITDTSGNTIASIPQAFNSTVVFGYNSTNEYVILEGNATSLNIGGGSTHGYLHPSVNVTMTWPAVSGDGYQLTIVALNGSNAHHYYETNITATGSTFSFVYSPSAYGVNENGTAIYFNQTSSPSNGLGTLTSFATSTTGIIIIGAVVAIIAVAAVTVFVIKRRKG